MNLMALMEHVSRHLHTIVRKYSRNRTLIEQVCERTDTGEADSSCWDDHLEQEPVTEAFLLDPLPSGIPKVSFSPSHTAYMTIETEEFVFLVGPVLLLDVQGYRHLFPQPDYDSAWLQTLYSCDLTELVTESLLLYNLFHENILSLQDIVNANCLSEEDQFAVQKLFNDIILRIRKMPQNIILTTRKSANSPVSGTEISSSWKKALQKIMSEPSELLPGRSSEAIRTSASYLSHWPAAPLLTAVSFLRLLSP